MMKKLFLSLLLMLALKNSYACSCNYGGSFLKLAPATPLIALVKITAWTNYKKLPHGNEIPHSMSVKIVETFKGKATTKTITVWGDNGAMCRPYISNFIVGQYYVIAFSRNSNDNNYYYINNCGSYWLKVNKKEKSVSGDINLNQHLATTTWPLKDLKKALQ